MKYVIIPKLFHCIDTTCNYEHNLHIIHHNINVDAVDNYSLLNIDSCSCISHVCYNITDISTVVRLCVMYAQQSHDTSISFLYHLQKIKQAQYIVMF